MDDIHNYVTIRKMGAGVGSMKTLARNVEKNAVCNDLNMEQLDNNSKK